jgi:hypothetical protein
MKSLIQFIEFILLPVIGITSRNIGTNSQDLFSILPHCCSKPSESPFRHDNRRESSSLAGDSFIEQPFNAIVFDLDVQLNREKWIEYN